MSIKIKERRISVKDIETRKGVEPIVCLTAYSAPMAEFIDDNVDIILVGDSLGMVLYGMPSTLGVTLDMMIAHGAAVVRGSDKACIIVDMPFGTYQESPQAAYRSCARVMAETGCSGVKLEGGVEMAETISFLTKRGIPVMGHIGLKPQSVHTAGGFKVQGRKPDEIESIKKDAVAVAEAGAFSIVIESTIEQLSSEITKESPIPTIGIGASVDCDGQVLVTEDILGLFSDFTPRFAKRYAELGTQISDAAEKFASDVKSRRFPTDEHCFKAKK